MSDTGATPIIASDEWSAAVEKAAVQGRMRWTAYWQNKSGMAPDASNNLEMGINDFCAAIAGHEGWKLPNAQCRQLFVLAACGRGYVTQAEFIRMHFVLGPGGPGGRFNDTSYPVAAIIDRAYQEHVPRAVRFPLLVPGGLWGGFMTRLAAARIVDDPSNGIEVVNRFGGVQDPDGRPQHGEVVTTSRRLFKEEAAEASKKFPKLLVFHDLVYEWDAKAGRIVEASPPSILKYRTRATGSAEAHQFTKDQKEQSQARKVLRAVKRMRTGETELADADEDAEMPQAPATPAGAGDSKRSTATDTATTTTTPSAMEITSATATADPDSDIVMVDVVDESKPMQGPKVPFDLEALTAEMMDDMVRRLFKAGEQVQRAAERVQQIDNLTQLKAETDAKAAAAKKREEQAARAQQHGGGGGGGGGGRRSAPPPPSQDDVKKELAKAVEKAIRVLQESKMAGVDEDALRAVKSQEELSAELEKLTAKARAKAESDAAIQKEMDARDCVDEPDGDGEWRDSANLKAHLLDSVLTPRPLLNEVDLLDDQSPSVFVQQMNIRRINALTKSEMGVGGETDDYANAKSILTFSTRKKNSAVIFQLRRKKDATDDSPLNIEWFIAAYYPGMSRDAINTIWLAMPNRRPIQGTRPNYPVDRKAITTVAVRNGM